MSFLLWLMLSAPQQAMPAMGKPTTGHSGTLTVVSATPLVLVKPLVLSGNPLILQ